MYKLINTDSFYNSDDLNVSVIDIEDTSSLTKQAADQSIVEFVRSLNPDSGKMYLHINAMGAGEYYGSNKNGDYFPEERLKSDYKTFETSPAHVFRHHINKDPAKAIGKVIFAIYNERMHRVELIAEVDRVLGKDVEERIAKGDFPNTSMACKTPYDVCSICGNKAHTRQEYCGHIAKSLNRVLDDGRKVMALNVAPLKFFDISIVIRPADITSSVLQKVASEVEDVPLEDCSSALAAEVAELSEPMRKSASFQKLSELLKEIETGHVVDVDENLDKILSKIKDPSFSTIEVLQHFELGKVLETLAHLGMSPSLPFLGELIARKEVGADSRGFGRLSYEALKLVGANPEDIPDLGSVHAEADPELISLLHPYSATSSMFPEYVEKRAFEQGYAFNGPRLDAEPKPEQKHIEGLLGQGNTSFMTKLLSIALGAVAAKWYIDSKIEARMRHAPKDNVKIVFVKQASCSDYELASKLSKIAMEQSVTVRQYDGNSVNLPRMGSKVVSLAVKGSRFEPIFRVVKAPLKLAGAITNKLKQTSE